LYRHNTTGFSHGFSIPIHLSEIQKFQLEGELPPLSFSHCSISMFNTMENSWDNLYYPAVPVGVTAFHDLSRIPDYFQVMK